MTAWELELLNEVTRLKMAVRRHCHTDVDDRCYLDDYVLYKEALPDEGLPQSACQINEPLTMISDCVKYIRSRHDPSKPYLSPQRIIERLRAEVATLLRQSEFKEFCDGDGV